MSAVTGEHTSSNPSGTASEANTEPVAADYPTQWNIAKNGRNFVRIPGVSGYGGVVWRQGDETVEQGIARRQAGPSDKAPRSRKARKLEERPPPENKSEVTRQIEEMMADILCSPSLPCAGFGMDWEAHHFDTQGARFAKNIARASERNPWLRAKLESGLDGEQTVIAWITSLNLVTGAVGYVLPPLMKWGILPAPDRARMMFGLPPLHVPPPPSQYVPPVTNGVEDTVAMFEAMQAAQASASPFDAQSQSVS